MKRFLLIASILSVLAASRGLLAADAPVVPTVLVRGVLVDANGSPLKAGVLHVASLDPSGKAFLELRDNEVLNPTATTDAGGGFAVAVPVAFFATGTAFTLGVARAEKGIPPGVGQVPLLPVRRNGAPASLSYRGNRDVIELGEVTLPNE